MFMRIEFYEFSIILLIVFYRNSIIFNNHYFITFTQKNFNFRKIFQKKYIILNNFDEIRLCEFNFLKKFYDFSPES